VISKVAVTLRVTSPRFYGMVVSDSACIGLIMRSVMATERATISVAVAKREV
jgi:hypothetical protein